MAEPTPDEGSPFDTHLARIAVSGYDGAQSMRIAMLNRVRDMIRKRNEGIPFDETEEEKDDEDRDWDPIYNDDNLADLLDEMYDEGKLDQRELEYLAEALEAAQSARQIEERYRSIMEITESEPVYQFWLQHVFGIGPTLCAKLIHTYGYCEDFDRVSNLWAYSGWAPGQKRKRGEKLGYNPDAKTLGWNIGDSFIKGGSRSRYRTEFYEPYKAEQIERMEAADAVDDWDIEYVERGNQRMPITVDAETGEELFAGTPPQSQAHADNRARRYMVKKFLKHYWYLTRSMKDLPTPEEWVVAHGGHEPRDDTFENPEYAMRAVREHA